MRVFEGSNAKRPPLNTLGRFEVFAIVSERSLDDIEKLGVSVLSVVLRVARDESGRKVVKLQSCWLLTIRVRF